MWKNKLPKTEYGCFDEGFGSRFPGSRTKGVSFTLGCCVKVNFPRNRLSNVVKLGIEYSALLCSLFSPFAPGVIKFYSCSCVYHKQRANWFDMHNKGTIIYGAITMLLLF